MSRPRFIAVALSVKVERRLDTAPDAGAPAHRLIAGFAKALRAYSLEKPPSVSEMIDMALSLQHLGIDEITNEHRDVLLPLLAKTERDRQRLLLRDGFASIIHAARHYAESMGNAEVQHSRRAPRDPVRNRFGISAIWT